VVAVPVTGIGEPVPVSVAVPVIEVVSFASLIKIRTASVKVCAS
jgi:hypothetical protein